MNCISNKQVHLHCHGCIKHTQLQHVLPVTDLNDSLKDNAYAFEIPPQNLVNQMRIQLIQSALNTSLCEVWRSSDNFLCILLILLI